MRITSVHFVHAAFVLALALALALPASAQDNPIKFKVPKPTLKGIPSKDAPPSAPTPPDPDQPPPPPEEKPPAEKKPEPEKSVAPGAGKETSTPPDPGPKVKASTVPKKGLCGWTPAHLEAVGGAWYYNWGPSPSGDTKAEFVPMIKRADEVTADVLDRVQRIPGVTHLLGFNEPERADQGNTTVDKALEVWPQLMATGLRLGSPAPSSSREGMDWLDTFMKGVERKKLRVDFIAVHWYKDVTASEAARQFDEWVRDLNKKYRRPVWVTEFAGMNWGVLRDPPLRMMHNVRFLDSACGYLEHCDVVERYAWFSTKPGDPASLFEDGQPPKLSQLGGGYRRAGP